MNPVRPRGKLGPSRPPSLDSRREEVRHFPTRYQAADEARKICRPSAHSSADRNPTPRESVRVAFSHHLFGPSENLGYPPQVSQAVTAGIVRFRLLREKAAFAPDHVADRASRAISVSGKMAAAESKSDPRRGLDACLSPNSFPTSRERSTDAMCVSPARPPLCRSVRWEIAGTFRMGARIPSGAMSLTAVRPSECASRGPLGVMALSSASGSDAPPRIRSFLASPGVIASRRDNRCAPFPVVPACPVVPCFPSGPSDRPRKGVDIWNRSPFAPHSSEQG